MSLEAVLSAIGSLSLRGKVLALAAGVVLVELGLRRFARRSRAYAAWTRLFQAIGAVWTAILLALIYLLSVGPVSLVMRLAGRDPLDRDLAPRASFWRAHEPHPLGPEAAARHQF